MPALIRVLGDAQPQTRAEAARALGALGDRAAAGPLAAALDDEAAEVRLTAARALFTLVGQESLPPLVGRLHDPAPEVRGALLTLLVEAEPTRAEALLIQALDDAQEGVRLEALRGLLRVPRPLSDEARARLLALEGQARPQEAAAAHLALAPRPARPSTDWVALLERTDGAQAAAAPALLTELERALPAAENLAVDPLLLWLPRAPRALRGRIAWLIARAGPTQTSKLLPLLEDADPEVRRAAIAALATRPDATVRAALLAALADREPQVSRSAAHALGRGCDPATLGKLQGSLHAALHPQRPPARERITLALAGCLAKLPSAALDEAARGELERDLLEQLERSRGDSELASLSVRGLAAFLTPRVLEALQQAYHMAPTPLRVAILRATVRDGSPTGQHLRAAAAESGSEVGLRATAWVAQWLAHDHRVTALSQEPATRLLPWPLGPVSAFVLASGAATASPVSPATCAALCEALSSPEPITRANARAALRPLAAPQARPQTPLDPHCVERLQASAGEPGDRLSTPLASPAPSEPGSMHALVFPDGRVLVSVADGSGDAEWPGLQQIVTENPWQWTYRTE
ncbi:MAG: HEAT repeat domain-containing protein [Myxococcales bacterium]